MPQYAALIYTADVDWSQPEYAAETLKYHEFGKAAAAVIRGGAALYPTATATTVTVPDGATEAVVSDGPYAETKEVLTGFYLFDCADLDEAIGWASRCPGAGHGAVHAVRPRCTASARCTVAGLCGRAPAGRFPSRSALSPGLAPSLISTNPAPVTVATSPHFDRPRADRPRSRDLSRWY